MRESFEEVGQEGVELGRSLHVGEVCGVLHGHRAAVGYRVDQTLGHRKVVARVEGTVYRQDRNVDRRCTPPGLRNRYAMVRFAGRVLGDRPGRHRAQAVRNVRVDITGRAVRACREAHVPVQPALDVAGCQCTVLLSQDLQAPGILEVRFAGPHAADHHGANKFGMF